MKTKYILIVLSAAMLLSSCSSVKQEPVEYTVDDLYDYVISEDSCIITLYKGSQSAVEVPGEINGSPVIEIGAEAFIDKPLITTVTLPDSIQAIRTGAFLRCENLQKINTPASLKVLEDSAFSNCKNLSAFDIPDTIEVLGGAFGNTNISTLHIPHHIMEIGPWMFCNTNVTLDVLHENITCIREHAFSFCQNIKELVIPESVTEVDFYAFANCNNLTEIYVHKNVTFLGMHAFAGDKLVNINVEPENPYYVSVDGVVFTRDMETLLMYPGGKKDTVYTVPEGVKKIGDAAFEENLYLTEILLPDSLSEIGYNAFIASGSLLTLTIPRNITYLDDSMILWCNTLTDLYIPDTVIDYSCFCCHGCDNMTVHCSENNPIYQNYKDKPYRIPYKFALDYK